MWENMTLSIVFKKGICCKKGVRCQNVKHISVKMKAIVVQGINSTLTLSFVSKYE